VLESVLYDSPISRTSDPSIAKRRARGLHALCVRRCFCFWENLTYVCRFTQNCSYQCGIIFV